MILLQPQSPPVFGSVLPIREGSSDLICVPTLINLTGFFGRTAATPQSSDPKVANDDDQT